MICGTWPCKVELTKARTPRAERMVRCIRLPTKRQRSPKLIVKSFPARKFLVFTSFPWTFCVQIVSMWAPSLRPQQITDLLAETGYWRSAQLDEVAPLVYEELRRLAQSYMSGERP